HDQNRASDSQRGFQTGAQAPQSDGEPHGDDREDAPRGFVLQDRHDRRGRQEKQEPASVREPAGGLRRPAGTAAPFPSHDHRRQGRRHGVGLGDRDLPGGQRGPQGGEHEPGAAHGQEPAVRTQGAAQGHHAQTREAERDEFAARPEGNGEHEGDDRPQERRDLGGLRQGAAEPGGDRRDGRGQGDVQERGVFHREPQGQGNHQGAAAGRAGGHRGRGDRYGGGTGQGGGDRTRDGEREQGHDRGGVGGQRPSEGPH